MTKQHEASSLVITADQSGNSYNAGLNADSTTAHEMIFRPGGWRAFSHGTSHGIWGTSPQDGEIEVPYDLYVMDVTRGYGGLPTGNTYVGKGGGAPLEIMVLSEGKQTPEAGWKLDNDSGHIIFPRGTRFVPVAATTAHRPWRQNGVRIEQTYDVLWYVPELLVEAYRQQEQAASQARQASTAADAEAGSTDLG